MATLKPGLRMVSTYCSTEVIVTRGGDGVITCGGEQMVAAGDSAAERSMVDDNGSPGTVLGKRYRVETKTVEVLCVRQGAGALQLDGLPLGPVKPKVLPASD